MISYEELSQVVERFKKSQENAAELDAQDIIDSMPVRGGALSSSLSGRDENINATSADPMNNSFSDHLQEDTNEIDVDEMEIDDKE